ncbi:MAG: 1,4-dihydroxy-2-naphthoate octaprenyltransferase [Mediterranea sp.]|nr:1,4-dihydroxy-2-naphthoate octaprenyltransferase [Mediterranea sp.]
MQTVKVNSLNAWFLAIRPKTLTGAVIPVMMGTALALHDATVSWLPALGCLLFACAMQVAANFINDLYDFLKGSDRADRLGPERACAQGWITPEAMKAGIGVTLLLAAAAGLSVLWCVWSHLPCGGWELVVLGAICMLFAFLYTTLLSYKGWGDLLVLLFFGLVPVCGTYYVQGFTITTNLLMTGLMCGVSIDTLLVVNNYRDREQDAVSGKRTLIVRYGEPFGRYLYLGLGIACWLIALLMTLRGLLSTDQLVWASSPYLLLHITTWCKMVRIRQGRELNAILGETSRNMLLMGLLWSLAVAS